jgi:diguanylate cyclase
MLAIGGPLTLALRDRDRLTQAVHLAGTDELTSLANRRNVVGGLGRALTTDRPLALMILDLDGFKHVNDTYGHPAGDLVLQVVAARLRASLGSDHLVARLGGDEFAVQVPEDDPAVLLQRAHAIRATLGRPIDIGPATVSIGVSIGITIRNPSHATPTDLLREADRAMYQAKLGAGATLHL